MIRWSSGIGAGDGTHIVSVLGIFDHEDQNLASSFATGSANQQDNSLNQIRANVTYYYQQTYGATVAWQKTWGSPNPLLYTPAPLTGSANGKPNSNAFIFEADYVPFGKADSWAGPFVNSGYNTRCIRSSTVARRTTTASAEQRATTTRSTCSPG